MSVNIQTSDGLLKISGDKVTKKNINKALGYTPANVDELPKITDDASDNLVIVDPAGNISTQIDGDGIKTVGDVVIHKFANAYSVVEHIDNTTSHITAAERANWNNKDYAQLTGAPNILEDDSGQLQVADTAGNVIMNVDVNGLQTHDVQVNGSGETVYQHHNNNVSHITASERNKWNNKSDFSGDYHELKNQPNIEEDNSGIIQVADDDGNVIVQIDGNGITTHEVIIEGEGINQKLEAHMADGIPHITAAERIKWNNKSDFSGNYHDLTDQPNIEEDNSGMVQIADNDGNVIAQIDSEGLTTNDVIVNQSGESVAVHHNNLVSHITAAERTAWNSKSEFSGHYTDLVGEPDITDEGESQKELTVADNSGNVKLRVDEDGARVDVLIVGPEEATTDRPVYDVGRTLKLHADTIVQDRSDFDDHDDDSVRHITAAERTSWNGKTTYSAIEADFVKQSAFNTHTDEFSAHTSDPVKHITAGERTKWNTASTDAATIKADYATNTALSNYKTDVAKTYETITNVNKVSAELDTHKAVLTGDGSHITTAERTAWNAKQTAAQVQTAINNAGHAKQTDLDTTNKNLTETTAKIDNHLAATNTHFSGYYSDLIGAPNIQDDGSGEVLFADGDGNVIMRVDGNGFRVNQVVIGTSEDPVDVGVKLDQLDRRLIEVGDLRGDWGVASEFITDYTVPADGKATANVEVHMFETFYIHPEYADTYTVTVTYDEWAGTVCDRRILAEHTGTHVVKVARKDGTAVTSGELSTIANIVEHIKTAFSIYFDKLYTIMIESGNDISESLLTFDTTRIVTAE